MKIILAFILVIISFNGFSQSATKFYFDADMHPASRSEAEIYGTGEMDSGLYKLTCYYLKRKHPIACVAHFTDSTQRTHEGPFCTYYSNGQIDWQGNFHKGEKEGLWTGYTDQGEPQDSTFFKNGRALRYTGIYDLPNKQKLLTVDDVQHNMFYTTLYDGQNKIISNETIPEDYTDVYIGTDTLPTFPGGAPGLEQVYITGAHQPYCRIY